MADLKDKVAIITGAGSGIGRASALLFAEHGAKVIASDITNDVEETAKGSDGDIIAIKADAGSEGDVEMLVEAAEQRFGDLHIFFANAGIGGGFGGVFDSEVAEWQEVLRVNLIGPFLATKYAGKVIADSGHGGSIICTASVAGIRSGAGGPAIQHPRQV